VSELKLDLPLKIISQKLLISVVGMLRQPSGLRLRYDHDVVLLLRSWRLRLRRKHVTKFVGPH
jgi:hypothetical protein